MEAAVVKPKRRYRKRKQHSSNPLGGVLTRNKSRWYLHHCTRSGKIRPDPVGKAHPSNVMSSTPHLDTSVLIKDLRAHRVFSKPLFVVKDANPNFDCELGEIRNPNFDCKLKESKNLNLSVLVKCGLDVEGLIEKNPNLSNVGNPNFDCELGEAENPNLSNVGNRNFDCELGEAENPNVLNVRNPRFNCVLGEAENPNLSVSVECDLDVEFNDNEVMIEQNPNLLSVQNHNFLEKFGLEVENNDEGLIVRNPNLLEKSNSVVNSKDEGLSDGNPSLFENFDNEVDCKVEGLNERSPNLLGICDSVNGEKDDKFGVGLACNRSVSDDMSVNLSDKDLNGRKCEDFEGLVEINAQSTPPDVVMSLSPTEDCNVTVKENVSSSLPQNQVSPNKDGSTEGKKANSILKKTSVLKPCSRPRVFRPLNSFSYRRLLPYLTDLAKDTSNSLKLDDHPKFENSDIVKFVVSKSRDSLFGSHESDEKQVTTVPVCEILEVSTSTNSKEEKVLSLDPRLNVCTLHVSTQIPTDQSHDDGQSYSKPNENQNVSHVSNGSPEGEACHDEQISLDNHEKLEDDKPVNESHAAELSEVCEESPKAPQEIAIVEDPRRQSLQSAGECRALQVECKTKENSVSSVLKPCSRPRVFKAVNSFSYRRLLPYLMDLAKDASSPLKLDDCPKSENSDNVKPVVSKSRDSLSGTHESDEKQVTTMPVCKILEVSTGTLHVSTQISMDQSHDDGQAYSVSNGNQIVTHISNGSLESGASHDKRISSDIHEKLEDTKPVNECHAAALSEVCEESLKAPQEIVIVEDQHPLSLRSAEECRTLQVECKTKENSIVCPVKGILKKNPRGCRGICDCLNCALFRINAEKAFELSRNQLLDTEELLQDMMGEMANLRSLLEKSANGAESIASIAVNQVQEACSRVSDVEAMARNRLSQMNEDLYVHCRNKRPRVNI